MVTFAFAESFSITQQPESQTIEEGESVTFTIEATGATSYQWQVNTGTGWANPKSTTIWIGAKTNTFTFTPTKTYERFQFRCVLTDANGNEHISDVVNFQFETPEYTITYDAGNGTFPDGSSFVTNNVQPGNYYLQAKDACLLLH